jgi:ribosomal protein S18 acetylase RimI-like enzyme
MSADDATPSLADVRLATADDADAVLRMMEVFNQHEGIAFTPPRLRDGYAELLAHPEWGALLLAEVGGVPSGYAVLGYGFDFEYGGRDAFLCELFVVERHRGKGIGRTLLASAEAHARSHGVRALHLIVRQENASAQILYRRSGFTFDPRLLMSKGLD